MRRAPLLIVLALAGCGSEAPAELPAPAGPPGSPPLSATPAGEVARSDNQPIVTLRMKVSVDRDHDRLRAGARSAPTCREPVAVETLGRGTRFAVLCGRERVVQIFDAATLERLGSAPAGIGPTGLATDGVDLLYVIDAKGESLLVYHLRPFELLRRVHLGGGPYAITFDEQRRELWITLNGVNQLVQYSASNRPVIRGTFPSIRNARSVTAVGADVTVNSAIESQTLRPRSP